MKSVRSLSLHPLRVVSVAALACLLNPALNVATGAMQRTTQIERALRRYERLRLDPAAAARRVRETGRFSFAAAGRAYDLVLEPHDLRAPWYQAEEELAGGGRRSLPAPAVNTYRGTVPDLADSEARFTFRDRFLEGVILTRGEWYYIEPMRNFAPGADRSEMVFYRRSDIRPEALGTCGATMAHKIGEIRELVEPQALASMSGVSTADVATEADYEYVTASGGRRRRTPRFWTSSTRWTASTRWSFPSPCGFRFNTPGRRRTTRMPPRRLPPCSPSSETTGTPTTTASPMISRTCGRAETWTAAVSG